MSSDHHQWGGIACRAVCFVLSVSLVASCMAACMFVWWRKRVCSTVMFTIYVMHAIRAFFRLPPSAALVELDDSVSYIDSGVITNWYRLMQLCCMASADSENAPALWGALQGLSTAKNRNQLLVRRCCRLWWFLLIQLLVPLSRMCGR